MNRNHFKKYAFTLVELIFVAMIIALIMPEMFSLYNFIFTVYNKNNDHTARPVFWIK